MSCDLKPTRRAGQHYVGNIFDVLDYPWDLAIFHPPCTHTSVSGSRYHAAKRMDGRQQAAVSLFMAVWRRSAHIPYVAFEQPVSVLSTLFRKPDQIIQPYEFGHDASKATCLWLRGLPKLRPTQRIPGRWVDGRERWSNQTDSGQNKLAPSDERAAERAVTYSGIAQAMADQWGGLLVPLRGAA